jgi:hypothetical protein
MSGPLPVPTTSNTFERIERVSSEGDESWSARDLARVLEYAVVRNFQPVIEKAKEACAKSGHAVADHFAEIRNMVGIGSGAQREVEDWALSRYACYLVIQNADPSKPLLALGQSYFAVQTRRQELADDEVLKGPADHSRAGRHDAGKPSHGRENQEGREPREEAAEGGEEAGAAGRAADHMSDPSESLTPALSPWRGGGELLVG